MAEFITAAMLIAGGVFVCLAGLGVVRMPDVYVRMHAATKAGTLGAGMILAAVAVHFADGGVAVRAVAAIVFLLITAPVAAHMIGRAAYRTGVPLWAGSVIDEWLGRVPDRTARTAPEQRTAPEPGKAPSGPPV
jgi:multicomponent Na+:H+ antiporter subunit G